MQSAPGPRQQESIRWLKDSEVKEYINNWTPTGELKTFFYDIRYDNKCNLACISCNPTSSSLWAKELGITTTKYTLDFSIDEIVSSKKIYLAGGEPLIIDSFISLIEQVAELDQQPELIINTNLTRVNDKLKNALSKVRNLTLTVSVDAFESVNDYHRWPLQWNKFLQNLIWARSIGCTIQFNSVVDAVTVLNIDQLCSIENYADQWNLTIINDPTALLINNLPVKFKEQIYNNFCRIKQSKFYQRDPVFKSRADTVANTILQPGNSALLSTYISEIDRRRNINHQHYLGINLI